MNINHNTLNTRLYTQRCIADIRSLLAKNGTQQAHLGG